MGRWIYITGSYGDINVFDNREVENVDLDRSRCTKHGQNAT
jgi:hypothetical protein